MYKLPENFEFHKYGIDVRLATEEDSAFILSLRTNGALNAFLHETSDDLEKQRMWMREYKKREKEGLDYYFVYSECGNPFGVDRVYNISQDKNSYTGGSWVCVPGVAMELVIRQLMASADIINNELQLDENFFDVRKGNKKVLRYQRQIMRAKEIGETEEDILFYVNANMRNEAIARLESYL